VEGDPQPGSPQPKDPQPGNPQGPGAYDANAPHEAEPAGPPGWDGAWQAAESGGPPPGGAGQRWRMVLAAGVVFFALAIVLTFVVIKLTTKPAVPSASPSGSAVSTGNAGVAPAAVIGKVTSVPVSALEAVGNGGAVVTATPHAIGGTALTLNGKPEMFYLGSEFCPFCAAERWAMIGALSRFGTFSGLGIIRSAAADGAGNAEPYPNTATWTFAKSSYSSQYLTFTPVENLSNIPDPSTGGYTILEKPTPAQQALVNKFDGPPYVPASFAGGIPFIDFGNKYAIYGASYSPGILAGLNWSQIAADLSNPTSQVAMGIDGTANYMTAAICGMTGNQPASACTATIQSLETQLKS
jgi:Domain of unknown function (DUF929)